MAMNRNLVVMSANTVANGATIFSAVYNGEFASGFRAVLITLVTASSVTITEQGSIDGTTFYDVVDGAGASLGSVASALTTTTGVYVQYNPVIARHNRLKVVAGADSTVSLTITSSEQL